MIHYHGTPITPRAQLLQMAGRHFCVSYFKPQDLKTCLTIGQSVMLDNGAYSSYTKKVPMDAAGYYRWLEPVLAPPHWGVVPDAIGGSIEEQHYYLARFPAHTFGYKNISAVWHLHLPFSHLFFLVNAYPKVCLGSSGAYWKVGSAQWCARMDETFNALVKHFGKVPYLHGMRMLGQHSGDWPLASADSTNVARNFKRNTGNAEHMAAGIDAKQPAQNWTKKQLQKGFFDKKEGE